MEHLWSRVIRRKGNVLNEGAQARCFEDSPKRDPSLRFDYLALAVEELQRLCRPIRGRSSIAERLHDRGNRSAGHCIYERGQTRASIVLFVPEEGDVSE